jgi:hypothetical protein
MYSITEDIRHTSLLHEWAIIDMIFGKTEKLIFYKYHGFTNNIGKVHKKNTQEIKVFLHGKDTDCTTLRDSWCLYTNGKNLSLIFCTKPNPNSFPHI